jgi:hypothetical protein
VRILSILIQNPTNIRTAANKSKNAGLEKIKVGVSVTIR